MNSDNRIAVGLKARRKELRLSAAEVVGALAASGIKVAEKTLFGWENGVSSPNVKTFLQLCRIYQIIDPMTFFGYVVDP